MASSSDGAARQCGMRPTPNYKQPPPEPSPSSPTSPASILVGSGAAGPLCASAAPPSPSAGAASVRCLLDPLPRPRPCACARAARPNSASRGHAEAGAGEQAVERVDGAMLEVLGADLLHPPRADARLLADEHIQGAGDAGGRGEGRAPSAPTSAAEVVPPSIFSASG
nr:nif-specific regulatory protein-like [Aegilops tauschii subsp. strangulata]